LIEETLQLIARYDADVEESSPPAVCDIDRLVAAIRTPNSTVTINTTDGVAMTATTRPCDSAGPGINECFLICQPRNQRWDRVYESMRQGKDFDVTILTRTDDMDPYIMEVSIWGEDMETLSHIPITDILFLLKQLATVDPTMVVDIEMCSDSDCHVVTGITRDYLTRDIHQASIW
jgi:hypothetical protein